MVAKNNVSEVRERFLACVTESELEKELFILSSMQCVNSDRQWRVVGLSVPVKSASVSIPCQVKVMASTRTILIFPCSTHSLTGYMWYKYQMLNPCLFLPTRSYVFFYKCYCKSCVVILNSYQPLCWRRPSCGLLLLWRIIKGSSGIILAFYKVILLLVLSMYCIRLLIQPLVHTCTSKISWLYFSIC